MPIGITYRKGSDRPYGFKLHFSYTADGKPKSRSSFKTAEEASAAASRMVKQEKMKLAEAEQSWIKRGIKIKYVPFCEDPQDYYAMEEWLAENTYKRQPADKDKIVNYLLRGIRLLKDSGDRMWDPFYGNTIDKPFLSHRCTDGEWIWSYDMAYWVEHYWARLDPRFIEHMRKKRYRISKLSPVRLVALSEVAFYLREYPNMSEPYLECPDD